jgi:uncharacterized protein
MRLVAARTTLAGRTVLLTGATGDIGAQTAQRLGMARMRVAVTGRRADRLGEVAAAVERAGGLALEVPSDLAEAEERVSLVKRVRDEWGVIDVLINNAGFGTYTSVTRCPWGMIDAMFAVNVEAAIHLSQLVLPEMLRRGNGHIVNVASVAGYVPAPPLTAYASTKAGLIAFSHGLRRELRRHRGIHVTVVVPGPARTTFGHTASGGLPVDPNRLPGGLRVGQVADAVARTLRRPRAEVVVPLRYLLAVRVGGALRPLVDVGAAWKEWRWTTHLERTRARATPGDSAGSEPYHR